MFEIEQKNIHKIIGKKIIIFENPSPCLNTYFTNIRRKNVVKLVLHFRQTSPVIRLQNEEKC